MRDFQPKYREDTAPKHKLTEEERGFLLALQKELNTQDTLCQADPRFWVIKDYERVYGTLDGDPIVIIDGEDYDSFEALRPIMEEIIEDEYACLYDEVKYEVTESSYGFSGFAGSARIACSGRDGDAEELEFFYDTDDCIRFLEDHGFSAESCLYKSQGKICPDTFFMTYKEAAAHLKANAHHYSDEAHPYAMTAWRSPEVEKLWKILQQVQW